MSQMVSDIWLKLQSCSDMINKLDNSVMLNVSLLEANQMGC